MQGTRRYHGAPGTKGSFSAWGRAKGRYVFRFVLNRLNSGANPFQALVCQRPKEPDSPAPCLPPHSPPPKPSAGRGSPPTAAPAGGPTRDSQLGALYRAGSLVHDVTSPECSLLGAGLCESVSVCSRTVCLSLLAPGPTGRPQPLPLSPLGVAAPGDAVAPGCEPRTQGGERAGGTPAGQGVRPVGRAKPLPRANRKNPCVRSLGTGVYRAPSCRGTPD